jgi:hypothetical protein
MPVRKSIRHAICEIVIGFSAATVIVAPWIAIADAVKNIPAEKGVYRAVHMDKLAVNTVDRIYAVVDEDERQGIQDLRKLLGSSINEEAWAYLPKKKVWIEIGINETITDRSISTTINCEKLEEIWRQNQEIIMYHIHPYLQIEDEKGRSYTAFPSHSDLEAMVKFSMEFYAGNPKGTITHKIASKYGITEYNLTEKGRELLKTRNVIPDYALKTRAGIQNARAVLSLSNVKYLEILFTPYALVSYK